MSILTLLHSKNYLLVVNIEQPPVLQPEYGVRSPVLGEDGVSLFADGQGGDTLHLQQEERAVGAGVPGPERSAGSYCAGWSP